MTYIQTGKQVFFNSKHVCDAVSEPMAIVLCENLNHNGISAGGEVALAIGEHAFRAGWDAALNRPKPYASLCKALENAWDAYDPPEDIKALS